MTPSEVTDRSRIQRVRVLFLALFFLSGIAGLMYQIVWTRMLVLVFGNTLLANSTVLSAFMAGLAAGSFVLGEHIDRKPRSLLRLYAGLELGIGLFGLAFPALVAAAAPLYSTLYQALDENLLVLNFFRFVLCFLLILVPTFLMGGTLPVLVKYLVDRMDRIGDQMGFLYGLNTAGAVVGCLAAGYWLLGACGLRGTTWIAVAINIGVAAGAWLLASRAPRTGAQTAGGGSETPEPSVSRAADSYDRPVVVAVLIGVALSGFCALAYEVLWVRMLNLFLNNNIYSFTATIATFLAGIALGSLIYARLLSRLRSKLALFAAIEIGIGLLAYVTPFLFGPLLSSVFAQRSESFTLAKTAVIMIAPTLLMGIAVPLAVQICQRGPDREGRSVGSVYGFNTVGSILGALVAGFVLIPTIGLHRSLIVVASLNLAAGFLVASSGAHGRRRILWSSGWVALVAVLFLAAPSSLFRNLYQRANPGSEILHYKEGKVVNVVVYDFYQAGYKDLHLNGIEEASDRLWHVQLFKLLGILPPLMHDQPNEALMIAFGAGMSAGAAVDLVETLDCVDLNPDIGGPAEIFRTENRDVIENPKFTVIANDGRNELLLDPKRYSVIISDATNPKMFDSWTLYTQEFYQLTKSRLEPGGVFAQWLVVPLPADSVKVILNTFRSVYTHASLWCIYGSSQCLMLGTAERLEIDYQDLASRLEPELESWDLVEYGIDSTEKLLSFLLLGEDELDTFLEGYSKVGTDDLPYAQFAVGSPLEGTRTMLELLRHRASVVDYLQAPESLPEGVEDRLDTYESISRRLHLGFLLNDRGRYIEAGEEARISGLFPEPNVASVLRYDHLRREHFERRLISHPDDANAYNNLGYIHWMQGDLERSIDAYDNALELRPDFANARANLAQVYIDAGRLDEAEQMLLQLRRDNPTEVVLAMVPNRLALVRLLRRRQNHPNDPEVHVALSQYYEATGDLMKAADALGAAIELRPDDLQLRIRLASIYERLEFVGKAREAYEAAAALAPESPQIAHRGAALARLESDRSARKTWLDRDPITLPDIGGDSAHPESCATAREHWNNYEFEGTVSRENLRTAARLFEQSIRSQPQDLHAYRDAAKIYEALGEPGEAAALLAKARAVAAQDPELLGEARRLELLAELQDGDLDDLQREASWLEVARLYRAQGEVEQAIEAIQKAHEISGGSSDSWIQLAEAYSAVGRQVETRQALEEALSRATSAEQRTSLQRHLSSLAMDSKVSSTPVETDDSP